MNSSPVLFNQEKLTQVRKSWLNALIVLIITSVLGGFLNLLMNYNFLYLKHYSYAQIFKQPIPNATQINVEIIINFAYTLIAIFITSLMYIFFAYKKYGTKFLWLNIIGAPLFLLLSLGTAITIDNPIIREMIKQNSISYTQVILLYVVFISTQIINMYFWKKSIQLKKMNILKRDHDRALYYAKVHDELLKKSPESNN